MTGKRPYGADGEDSDAKRARSVNGSPAPTSATAQSIDFEKKKQEATARMEAVKARLAASKANASPGIVPMATTSSIPSADPNIEAKKAEAQRRIAEMKARMLSQQTSNGSNIPSRVSSPATSSSLALAPDAEARMAQARARAAELTKRHATAQAAAAPPPPPPPRHDNRSARGGLAIGLHPSLMGDGPGKAKFGQQGPKFSTTKGNQQPEKARINPYLANDEAQQQRDTQDGSYDPSVATQAGARKSKQLVFNAKGKFIHQANALRQQARLEEMKRRLAADARKTQIEEATDKAFLVPAPPDVEWWDEGLLPEGQDSYAEWESVGRNKIEGEGSIITALIQHPVMLQAPQDKLIPEPKPLMLTQKEQKKLRRQRRMADMKEEQAKIRLGLVEPPPPKVKKSNMMRVLGEQAVKDPTAVEARVNREITQRLNNHEQANAERQLTKEERAEKLKAQQSTDDAKGIQVAVFRVDDFGSGKHRYQVDVNAKQQGLTGIVILNPEMNIVVVEGGAHSINDYKKLLLRRIKWTENTAPLSDTNGTTFTGMTDGSNTNASTGTRESGSKAAGWCSPFNEEGYLKDLGANRCVLVWEGSQPTRSFKRWGSRACETDGEAKDVLHKTKMENMWTLAKSK